MPIRSARGDHFGFANRHVHDGRNGCLYSDGWWTHRSQRSRRVGKPEDIRSESGVGCAHRPLLMAAGRSGAIPFKSIPILTSQGTGQTWGIQMRRAIRRKERMGTRTPLPTVMGGSQGFFRISAAQRISSARTAACQQPQHPRWKPHSPNLTN